jgi:hypothetical protein
MLTGSENMGNQDLCQGCGEQHRCEGIYERLGRAEGPSVVPGVLAGLLLPLVVFIVSLAAFERIIGWVVEQRGLQTALGAAAAVLATLVCVVVTRAIRMRSTKSGDRTCE